MDAIPSFRVLAGRYLEGDNIKVVHFKKERNAAAYARDIKRAAIRDNAKVVVYRDNKIVVVYEGTLPEGTFLRIEMEE